MSRDQGMDAILTVISRLLGPGGCPWDREQTPDSLCDYLVEETFELVSAVRSGDISDIREEMGDVFFLLFFMARLYQQDFSLDDVWQKNAAKMISRHPHVFEDQHFESREELLRNWEKVKKEEKQENRSTFASIPKNLPPMIMAYRLNSKAARLGFTWGRDQEVEDKLSEEWQEFLDAVAGGDPDRAREELGDYLFTLVEYGRRKKIKASSALSMANTKFLGRVQKMEKLALKKGLDISGMDMNRMDALWDEVKEMEQELSGTDELPD
jgi:nucleoside triphosphate diphosphatase